MEIHRRFHIPAPVDRVAEVLCSPRYAEARAAASEGVASMRYEATGGSGGHRTFDVHMEEYARTMRGKIDRDRTRRSIVHNYWNPDTGELTFTIEPIDGEKFDASGRYRLEPDGDGTALTYDMDIEIHVPLIGKKISGLVARGIESGLPDAMKLLEKLCAEDDG